MFRRRQSTLRLYVIVVALLVADLAAARPTVGLVLGGGGARGGAHVGVIRVLEDLNVPVDYVVGTSMGAVVGGLYASGMSAAELETVVHTADWDILLSDRPPRAQRSYRRKSDDLGFLVDFDLGVDQTGLLLPGGLVQGQNMDLALRRMTLPVAGIEDFDTLPIPFRSVATDIASGEMVVFATGDLVTAMHASMAVPGIFRPERVDGRVLVDGGITSNLPIEVMRELGADVIIAVDLGFPLLPEEELKSGLDVTLQMLTILINDRAADQLRFLRPGDVHIKPELGMLGSQEFGRLAEAMEAGRRAALAASAALERLAIAPARFEEYRAAIAGRRNASPVIDRIEVENHSRLADKAIEARLDVPVGAELDLGGLERDIADVYALDTFESVSYRVAEIDGASTLQLRAQPKAWGPNYLRFGINIEEDFQGGSNYNVATRLTMTELNPLGGEFRSEFQIGETPRIFAEWFQPLDYRARWFLNPSIELQRTTQGFFENGAQLAQLSASQATVALYGGRQFGATGEFRVGLARLWSDESLLIGPPGLASGEGDLAVLAAQYAYDTIDQVDIPLQGTLLALSWNGSRTSLGSDGDFDLASFFLLKPMTWGRNTLLHWWNIDATVRDQTAGVRPFTLGGPFSLTGYAVGELRGKHRGIGRLLYYRRYGEDTTPGLDLPVYLGFSLEAGNAWQSRDDVSWGNTLVAGSLFVVFDTLLGPLYLGYGAAEGDRESAFLYLGQTF